MRELFIFDRTGGYGESVTTDNPPLEAIDEWFATTPYDTNGAEETIEVGIEIHEPDTDGRWSHLAPLAEKRFTVDPPEPPCDDDAEGHEWKRPPSILAGTNEHPGAADFGGGVMRQTQVCRNCGRYRHTDNHGNLDHERVSYDEPDQPSLEWARRKRHRRTR